MLLLQLLGAKIISLTIYLFNKNTSLMLIKAKATESQDPEIKMDAKEVKQRLYALLAVLRCTFFWFFPPKRLNTNYVCS